MPFSIKIFCSKFTAFIIVDSYINQLPDIAVAVGKDKWNVVVVLDMADFIVEYSEKYRTFCIP